MNKVGYLGNVGSYSFLAAKNMINKASFIGKPDFKSIFDSLQTGKIDLGILPIENSTTGSIFEVYDLLLDKEIEIVGEGILKINHLLLAKRGSYKKNIKRCYCQIEAWKQCQMELEKRKIAPIFVEDTASAVHNLAKDKDLDTCAIGNNYLAQKYGLKIISDSIQKQKGNFTRFVSVGSGGVRSKKKGEKVSMIFSVLHQPGSLLRALTPYAEHGLNLTKIESRPILNKPWEYIFIVDFILKNIDNLDKVVKEMKLKTLYLKILGVYQKGKIYEA